MSFLGSIKRWLQPHTQFANAPKAVFHPTHTCAECGSKLFRELDGDEWRCPNLDCPPQVRARLEHWCSPAAMDIAGADAALVVKLVGTGLARDPAELYRLKVAEIAQLEGMNLQSAQSLFDAITVSQKREGWRLLFGLSIPHVGAKEAQALCEKMGSVSDVLDSEVEELRQVNGISDTVARSIVYWRGDGVNRRLVRRLRKAGLNFNS